MDGVRQFDIPDTNGLHEGLKFSYMKILSSHYYPEGLYLSNKGVIRASVSP